MLLPSKACTSEHPGATHRPRSIPRAIWEALCTKYALERGRFPLLTADKLLLRLWETLEVATDATIDLVEEMQAHPKGTLDWRIHSLIF